MSDFYDLVNGKKHSWCKLCVKTRALERKKGIDDVTERVCRRCKVSKMRSDFTGRRNICNECVDLGHKNLYHSLSPAERVERNRKESLRKVYKLTVEQFEEMSKDGCAVCGTHENLCVDHDHSCCPGKYTCGNCVRGILCAKHNMAEGALSSVEEVEALLSYKIKFNEIGDVAS